jgi:PAS domain S-box-containing protein
MTGKPSYGELEKRVQILEAAEARRSTPDSALEKLFNLSTDMLCVADVDGYFRSVNSAFENALGYTRQELLGTPSIDFVHPDDKAATLAVREKLEATGEPLTCFENRFQCKDGSYKWLVWNSVIAPEDGLVYAVARDVTGQKVIQQELAAQRDLFD